MTSPISSLKTVPPYPLLATSEKGPVQTPTHSPEVDKFCPQPTSTDGWIVKTKGSEVSSNFLEQVRIGLASLPETIRNTLREAGGKIKVARFLTEANPELKHDFLSSYETADQRHGVHIGHDIYLAEYAWATKTIPWKKRKEPKAFASLEAVHPPVESQFGMLAFVIDPGIHRTVRHEMGHLFDKLLLRPSSSENFIKAYKQDLQGMNQKQQAELDYYIQPNKRRRPTIAGRREAFAEAFAALYGGGCHKAPYFKKHFPNVVQYVKTLTPPKEEPASLWNKIISCVRPSKSPAA